MRSVTRHIKQKNKATFLSTFSSLVLDNANEKKNYCK